MASNELKVDPQHLSNGGSSLGDLGAKVESLVRAHVEALAGIKFVTGGDVEDTLTKQFNANYQPGPINDGVEKLAGDIGALGDGVKTAAKNYTATETNATTVANPTAVQGTGK